MVPATAPATCQPLPRGRLQSTANPLPTSATTSPAPSPSPTGTPWRGCCSPKEGASPNRTLCEPCDSRSREPKQPSHSPVQISSGHNTSMCEPPSVDRPPFISLSLSAERYRVAALQSSPSAHLAPDCPRGT